MFMGLFLVLHCVFELFLLGKFLGKHVDKYYLSDNAKGFYEVDSGYIKYFLYFLYSNALTYGVLQTLEDSPPQVR